MVGAKLASAPALNTLAPKKPSTTHPPLVTQSAQSWRELSAAATTHWSRVWSPVETNKFGSDWWKIVMERSRSFLTELRLLTQAGNILLVHAVVMIASSWMIRDCGITLIIAQTLRGRTYASNDVSFNLIYFLQLGRTKYLPDYCSFHWVPFNIYQAS